MLVALRSVHRKIERRGIEMDTLNILNKSIFFLLENQKFHDAIKATELLKKELIIKEAEEIFDECSEAGYVDVVMKVVEFLKRELTIEELEKILAKCLERRDFDGERKIRKLLNEPNVRKSAEPLSKSKTKELEKILAKHVEDRNIEGVIKIISEMYQGSFAYLENE